ncbi:glycosyltransferase [Actinopolymorpha sp. B11F2]|uniref:glycosyltransferase n=1 Tax=Actinopolymorpha sp. B11F2 TaxID=3160862 RepID=UPI0032E44B59
MSQPTGQDPMIKVSVVVPVYNAGRYLEECAASLLAQSLSSDEYEIIFVDDGSTDDSPAAVDKLAAEYPHVRVHHQANSGWPGKPRNVGVAMARGAYVQFVDQDDQLGPEALERMYAMGSRNGSDIVLGKVGGTMGGPSSMFRENVERCTIADTALIESVSPHKMFRRAFLLDHDIWFPEGKRRLEDQLFMVQAYLEARTVSIVGDYVCYYWNRRDDGKNSSGTASTMRGYYNNLREVLDAIEAGTEPGELRNRLMGRFFRVEMMRRLGEPRLLRYSDGYRNLGYRVVRELAVERFSSGGEGFATGDVVAGLSPMMRLRAMLLERERLDGLMELARRCGQVRATCTVDDVRWEGTRLCLDLRTSLVHADGSPVVVLGNDGRYALDPTLAAGLPTIDAWDVGDPCEHAKAEIRVRHRDTGTWWFAPATLRPSLVPVGSGPQARFQVVVAGTASIDPHTLAGGAPCEPGRYDVVVSLQVLGLGRPARVIIEAGQRWSGVLVPGVVGDPARIVVPQRATPNGALIVDVDERQPSLAPALAARGVGPLDVRDGDLHVALPMHTAKFTGTREVEVVLGREGSSRALPARLQPPHLASLVFDNVTTLPSGRHPLSVRVDSSGRQRPVRIGTVVVEQGRIVDVLSASYRTIPHRAAARVVGSPWLQRQARRAIAVMPASEKTRDLARRLGAAASRKLR